jgi:hypothetical protein
MFRSNRINPAYRLTLLLAKMRLIYERTVSSMTTTSFATFRVHAHRQRATPPQSASAHRALAKCIGLGGPSARITVCIIGYTTSATVASIF